MEKLAKYVRENRPALDPLEYDRHIRLLLNWLDTHKIRERAVFEAMEGKEYGAMLQFVEERTAKAPEITEPLFQLLLEARRPAYVSFGASASSVGGRRGGRSRGISVVA